MAIAIGNGTYSNLNPGAATQTLAHNQNSGSDRMLVVTIAMQNTVFVTGMTYNGTPMAFGDFYFSSTYSKNIYTYYLLAPDTGNNNIVISFSGSQFNPTAIFARSFTGANGLGLSAFDDGSTSPNSKSLTISANSIIFAAGISGFGQSFGYDIGGSTRTNVANGFNINNIIEGAYSATGLSAGSQNVTTKADAGPITNYRVEILEGSQGGGGFRRRIIVT